MAKVELPPERRRPVYHRDGSLSYWSHERRAWVERATVLTPGDLLAMPPATRERVAWHLKYGAMYRRSKDPKTGKQRQHLRKVTKPRRFVPASDGRARKLRPLGKGRGLKDGEVRQMVSLRLPISIISDLKELSAYLSGGETTCSQADVVTQAVIRFRRALYESAQRATGQYAPLPEQKRSPSEPA